MKQSICYITCADKALTTQNLTDEEIIKCYNIIQSWIILQVLNQKEKLTLDQRLASGNKYKHATTQVPEKKNYKQYERSDQIVNKN